MANNKEQGTYENTLNNSEAAFLKYKKQIAIAVIAIIVIIAGVILYKNYISAPREAEASTELAKSQTFFNAQQYDKALTGFQKVQSDSVTLMQVILLTFMWLFAMHIRLNQTGQRLWKMQRSLILLMMR